MQWTPALTWLVHAGTSSHDAGCAPGGAQGKITKNVEREILNHSQLIHPHVVRFEECFLTPKYLAIAMEYAEGGTMYSHVTSKCASSSLVLPRMHASMTASIAFKLCAYEELVHNLPRMH